MSPEEKKLEKLNTLIEIVIEENINPVEKLEKLFELINEEYATPDDLIQLSEVILGFVTTEKERLNALIEDEKVEDKKEKAEMVALLNTKEQGLKNIINRLSSDTDTAISQATTRLSNEIKRVEKKIPTKTDLTALEADIKALGDGLNSLSTEITANGEAVRDSLELLQDEERLDKSAIKGLDDWEEIAALARTQGGQKSFGIHLLRYLSDVNIEGITNGQTILWNSTTNRFEPGSGGSSTQSFETVSKNLDASGATLAYTGENLTSITYLNGIIKTLNYTGENLTSVVLSGSTPGGIDLTKTLSYTGDNLTGVSYA